MKDMRKNENMNKNLNRRDFLRLGGLSTGALVLAACGGGDDEEEAEEPDAGGEETTGGEEEAAPTEAPAAEAKTITWWVDWSNVGAAVDAIAALPSFKEHLGNQNLEYLIDIEWEQLLTAIAGGDPPDGASNVDYPNLWARGALIPVDDFIAGSSMIDADDMLPALWESGIYDGQMIGVPGIEGFIWWGLNYNTQHIEEAGLDPDNPPTTFDGALEWHKALTEFDDAGNLIKVGFDPYDAMAGEPDYPAFSHGLRWWNDEAKTFHLDDPRMAEAVNTFGEFYRIAGPDNMAAMRATEGQGGWGASFNAGVQSMIHEGYWHPGETQIQQPDIAQFNRASWPLVPASRDGTKIMATGAHFVVIFKDGKNQEGMFNVAEFLHTPEAMDIFFNEVGWLTGRISYIESVPRDAYPGIDFYLDAPAEVDEWLVGRRCPIHWFIDTQWAEMKEAVYRDLMSPEEAVAEVQRRAVDEWDAQGLG